MNPRPAVKIQLVNTVVAYEGRMALSVPELTISGNVIALLGHNGAGKSTLIKTLLGLLPLAAGSIKVTLGGELLTPSRHMAFCPENGSVFADISVEAYLKLWSRTRYGRANYYRTDGRSYIERLALESLLPRLGRELSKGQRRRVQTAVGFLLDPRFFLFDEPFDGLDVQRTRELIHLIDGESERRTFLISSHRMGLMERVADSGVVLHEGKIAAAGAIQKVAATLAGKAFIVRGGALWESALQAELPQGTVVKSGDDLHIAGHDLLPHTLAAIVQRHGGSAAVEEVPPTLAQGMDIHLLQVRRDSGEG